MRSRTLVPETHGGACYGVRGSRTLREENYTPRETATNMKELGWHQRFLTLVSVEVDGVRLSNFYTRGPLVKVLLRNGRNAARP